jgi:hypothetical protein
MAKRRNKRTLSKYPGLDPQVNLRIRREVAEIDYMHKLSKEEKLLS